MNLLEKINGCTKLDGKLVKKVTNGSVFLRCTFKSFYMRETLINVAVFHSCCCCVY